MIMIKPTTDDKLATGHHLEGRNVDGSGSSSHRKKGTAVHRDLIEQTEIRVENSSVWSTNIVMTVGFRSGRVMHLICCHFAGSVQGWLPHNSLADAHNAAEIDDHGVAQGISETYESQDSGQYAGCCTRNSLQTVFQNCVVHKTGLCGEEGVNKVTLQ